MISFPLWPSGCNFFHFDVFWLQVGCYSEILRVLKPGQYFAAYEWALTDSYNPQNEDHKECKVTWVTKWCMVIWITRVGMPCCLYVWPTWVQIRVHRLLSDYPQDVFNLSGYLWNLFENSLGMRNLRPIKCCVPELLFTEGLVDQL